eukprot:1416860-Heterocapsa_arctica.AAC.1
MWTTEATGRGHQPRQTRGQVRRPAWVPHMRVKPPGNLWQWPRGHGLARNQGAAVGIEIVAV